jgi:hypothetical protein
MKTLEPDEIMKKGDVALYNADDSIKLVVGGYAGDKAGDIVNCHVVRIESAEDLLSLMEIDKDIDGELGYILQNVKFSENDTMLLKWRGIMPEAEDDLPF